MIELKHIRLSYHKPLIIDGNLILPSASITAIIGKSGLGKTTLLNQLGFIDPKWNQHCEYYIDGKLINQENIIPLYTQHYFYLFQRNNLIEEMTCYDNLLFLASMRNIPVNKEMIFELFDRLHADIDLEQYPNMISGGQRQKLEIVMLALLKPKVILCDEITSALDPQSAVEIFEMLKEVVHEIGSTCVVVTHDPRIYENCDSVYAIENEKLVPVRYVENNQKIDLSITHSMPFRTYLDYLKLKLMNKAFLQKSLVVGILFAIMISSFNLIYRYSDENKEKLATSLSYDTNQEFIYDYSDDLSFQGTPYLETTSSIEGKEVIVEVGNSSIEIDKHIVISNEQPGIYMNVTLADELGITSLSDFREITFQIEGQKITADLQGIIRDDYSDDGLAHIYLSNQQDFYQFDTQPELLMYYEENKDELENVYQEITSHDLEIYSSLKNYDTMLQKNQKIDFYINILLGSVFVILIVFTIVYSILQYEGKKKEITLLYNRGFRLGTLTLLNLSENIPILVLILIGSPLLSLMIGKQFESHDILFKSGSSMIFTYLILSCFTGLLIIGLSQFMISLIYTKIQKKQF